MPHATRMTIPPEPPVHGPPDSSDGGRVVAWASLALTALLSFALVALLTAPDFL